MNIIRALLVSLALVSTTAVGCSSEEPGEASEDMTQSIAFEELDIQKPNSPAGLTVIKDTQSFVDFFGQPPPSDVRFSSHWVVHVSAGMKNSGGYDIDIMRIGKTGTGSNRTLVVYGLETSPGLDCAVTQAITNPQITVRINKQASTPQSSLDLAKEEVPCSTSACCDPASKPPAFEPTECCLGADGPQWVSTGSAHPCNDVQQAVAPVCEPTDCCDPADRPPPFEPLECCLGPDGPQWQSTGSAHPCNDLQQEVAPTCSASCDPTLICGQAFTCVDGKCVRREDARPTPAKQVTVNDRGEALILVSCGSGGGCSGSVTIQTPGGAGGSSLSRWAVPVVGARRFVFGSRRFKLPAGRSTKVKVKLTRVGLKTLRRKKKARVVAIVRTVDERNGAVVNTSKPFTLKAPKAKKRRR